MSARKPEPAPHYMDVTADNLETPVAVFDDLDAMCRWARISKHVAYCMAGTGGQYYDSKVMSQLFGVSVRRIQQLTQDGVIETVPLKVEGRTVRRYELVPTIQAYTKYLADKAYGREQINTEAELKEQKLKAEIALKESQGELHRLRTAIAAGEYISIEETRNGGVFFPLEKNSAKEKAPAKTARAVDM